jgi:hypothetical protein
VQEANEEYRLAAENRDGVRPGSRENEQRDEARERAADETLLEVVKRGDDTLRRAERHLNVPVLSTGLNLDR